MSQILTFKPLNSHLTVIKGDEDMLKDWSFWCSVITALASMLALGISIHQTMLSNKQHLFDRRLKAYILASGLVSLCKEHYMWLSEKREKSPCYTNDFIFIWLTNNTYMESQAEAIEHPMEEPFHKEFLRKLEELRNMAMEFELIFKGEVASKYRDFLRAYEESLVVMYQYQIVINGIREEKKEQPMTKEELEEIFSEEKWRDKRYSALEKLRKTYDAVSQEKIEKQIRKQLELI